jgi:hypothetical protein
VTSPCAVDGYKESVIAGSSNKLPLGHVSSHDANEFLTRVDDTTKVAYDRRSSTMRWPGAGGEPGRQHPCAS